MVLGDGGSASYDTAKSIGGQRKSSDDFSNSSMPVHNLNWRKSSRKQWGVQGEPHIIIQKLRSQLAEDGCAESQYSTAKSLLDFKEVNDYQENCRQAIFWLTQSSLQGCLLATKKLEECLASGLGICEENYEEVKRCLEMDQQEKLAQVAAKQLFASLNQGNNFVSLRRLNETVEEMVHNLEDGRVSLERKKNNFNAHHLYGESYATERISEENLIEAAKIYIHGEVPSIPIKSSFSESTWMRKVAWKSYVPFVNTLHSLFDWLSSIHFVFAFSLTCIFILSIHFCKNLVFSKDFLWLIALATMVYSSAVIMISQLHSKLFHVWSLVFRNFCPDLNVQLAKAKRKGKQLRMYGICVGSLVFFVGIFPIVDTHIKSLFFPLFFSASVIVLTAFFTSNVLYNILSSGLYILAHCTNYHQPIHTYIVAQFPFIEPYMFNESFLLWNGLKLNLNIGSIVHCIWFVSVIFASFTLGLMGVLRHLLCIVWLHLLLVTVKAEALSFDLSIFIPWIVLLLPFSAPFISIIIPSCLSFLCFLMCEAGIAKAAVISLSLMLGLVIGEKFFSNVTRYAKILVVLICLTFLVKEHIHSSQVISPLKWEHYQNICLPSEGSISARMVRQCKPLEGTLIHWKGIVKQVEVESFFNWAEVIISLFPRVVHPYLKCLVGDKPQSICNRDSSQSETEYQHCLLVQSVNGLQCSIRKWDSYQFRITVSMVTTFWKLSKTADVALLGGNAFEKTAFALSLQDRISFIGVLSSGLGSSLPEIQLSAIHCVDCATDLHMDTRSDFHTDVLLLPLKSLFNFILSPTFSL